MLEAAGDTGPRHGHRSNVRGAYREVLSDFAGAGAVIVAGLAIAATGVTTADALASILVRAHILGAPRVTDCHDLHVWTITSGMNVVSAHVIVEPDAQPAEVLDHLCACLAGFFDIEHSTFQIETADRRPLEDVAHA